MRKIVLSAALGFLLWGHGAAQDAATQAVTHDSAVPGGSAIDAAQDQRIENLEKEFEQFKSLNLVDPNWMRVFWKDAVRIETVNKMFTMKLGGRMQLDTAFFEVDRTVQGAVGDQESGVEFRRARIAISGTVYEVFYYKFQYDFAGTSSDPTAADHVEFKDVFIGLRQIPCVGAVRVGHFKEPFGLEELTSSNDITFMERSLTSPFTPVRNVGIMGYGNGCENRMSYAVGVFRETDDFGFQQGDGEFNVTGRVTGTPWYEEGGERLLHLGFAATDRSPSMNATRFRERPEAHLADRFVDTGAFFAGDEQRIGGEVALVCGPFSVQGEIMKNWVNGIRGVDDREFCAYYLMTSYILTGEHRPYRTGNGVFGRPRPDNPFAWGGGCGAWELAARYSHIDLDDGGVDGGELHDITAGVNWYPNANLKFMMNYIHAYLEGLDSTHILMFRAQIAM